MLDIIEKFSKPIVQRQSTLTIKYDDLLPIERSTFHTLKTNKLAQEFREIDMSFLSMTVKQQSVLPIVPKFSIFHVFGDDIFSLWLRREGFLVCGSTLSNKKLEKFFIDVYKTIGKQSTNFSINRLISKFIGIIPSEIKDSIKEHKSKFDNLYLVKEADNWTFKSEPIPQPPSPDPLIIGEKNNKYYLISQFDLTNIEKYIVSEF